MKTPSEFTAIIKKMKNICNQFTAKVAVFAVTSMATLINVSSANAASFELNWTGNNGYSAQGKFSFDDSLLGSVVTKDNLDKFSISFFNPTGNLLRTFDYSFPNPSSSFNFNFNPATNTVLQTGNFDTPTGFDLGDDFNTSLTGPFFYTFADPTQGLDVTTIYLNDGLSTEVCIANGNCGYDFGGRLTATKVPEPGVILGFLGVAALGGFLKKKPASA
ncbi:PEP-CTERM sorting domain-containing protein [Nostoc sp. PCC 7524]|uniref:PEP-CTERM sorting domain-containing protein n=1 Tax=Nostoc sp. (strain ATCC 29411 / PCC 7524) TaxID=28072 RepID=UPI001F390119|nr:PEP-CTERM sorting domain-containing protein [Nostoc sp. PCC 7524]